MRHTVDPTPPRRVWPQRWSAALRDRLQFLRLLTLLLALLPFYGSLAAFGFAITTGRAIAGTVAAMLALTALWIHGYRREGLPLWALPFELGLLMVYLVGVNPEFRPFGALYLVLQHRAMYGTRRDATVISVAYAIAFITGKLLLHDSVLAQPLAIVLQLSVGGFGAYVAHTLAELLARDAERKRRLRASEERYRVMFDNSPWPMWLFDPATLRFVDINESAVLSYGYSREEFLAMTLYDIRPPSEYEALAAARPAMTARERTSFRVRHHRKSGEIIDVEVTAHPVQFEGRELRLAVAVDVSEQARAERALRESEARFRSLANCLREAVLVTDRSDRIILANARVRDVLGLDPDSVIGKTASELLLPASQRNAFADRMRRRLEGESELYEIELVRGDGQPIIAEVSASPYRDGAGNIMGTLGAISDVTERKKLEERVRQSSRLEAVGQLAGGVAHDFNNLLTVIKCHAELLRDELPAGDVLHASVREIEVASDRAADVTGQLLAFSRKQLMQPRRISLDGVITEALPVMRKMAGARVEIATSTDGSTPTAFADPTQLETVLVTLIRNACEAMPRGGRILIGTETRELEARELPIQHQHVPAGTYTVLTVTDTGTGMDDMILKRLFEPFFTTKEVGAGTGMSLASMFGIVRQSGGYVDVQSAPNQGTTFLIYLPTPVVPTSAEPALA